ncbi:MFS transporter [Anaeromyxobacter diazotrophicus]|uniref:MFS transporter n=1 Tax=Anaeromyxobacter diazotrophicus TaxID=2590199 RepID=A0A7I9VRB4_9BACT|nr:MFS transporter [Anaeromyxobacter diazotrophicus]GEJ58955.1 MFS transporter [Anaeromyxobacter diazotrophicus]
MARRIHYGWFVVGTTFVVLLVSAAIRATPGVLIVPLEHEFGWERATISLAISVNLLLYGLMGPFCAAIADRIGLRRTMALAMGLLASALLLAPLMSRPWHLVLLWGVLVGAGTGMAAMVIGTAVVTRWFTRHRGVVLGALTASTATGQLLFLPLLARVAEDDGWRAALRIVAVAAAGAAVIAFAFVRESPAALGLRPYGAADGDPVVGRRPGNPAVLAVRVLARAARSRDFWLLAGTFFVCGASTNGLIGTHLIPACMDHGMPEVRAAGLLATMGIFDLFGTTLSGWLTDRWDSRRLLFAYYGLRGLSLVLLPDALVNAGTELNVFTVFYGLDWIATVPPTVRLATDAFGAEDAPIVFGWVFAAHQVGAGLAALGAGIVRTRLGDYHHAFVASGVICLVAALLALLVNRRGARAVAPALGVPSGA